MTIQTKSDLDEMAALGRLVAEALDRLEASARPGVTTGELDALGEKFLTRAGCRSAPRVFYEFPGFNCISVNEEIVHGIPGARALKPGDVLKLDVTVERGGYVVDSARTVVLEPGSRSAHALVACARAAFDKGLAAAKPGARVAEIGRAVETEVKRHGFGVLRELSGHGVGRAIHEPPTVPNYYSPLTIGTLEAGMVIAFEPIISEKPARAIHGTDGWTIFTSNGTIAAHHEHTIVIMESGPPLILTAAAA